MLRVWGRYTSSLLLALLEQPMTARELEYYTGIKSSKVYPLLRYWIQKRVVLVEKLTPSINRYSVREELRKAVRRALELYAKVRPYQLRLQRLYNLAEARLLRRLRPVERELLAILLQLLVEGGSPYLRIRGPYAEALAKLKDTLRRRLEKAGLDPRAIAQELHALTELLEELAEHHIVYIHYDHKTQTLVLRLDKTLEHKLQQTPTNKL